MASIRLVAILRDAARIVRKFDRGNGAAGREPPG